MENPFNQLFLVFLYINLNFFSILFLNGGSSEVVAVGSSVGSAVGGGVGRLGGVERRQRRRTADISL
jgi:hypothetical protein